MLRAGDVILLCVLALLSIGVVMVNSAGLTVDPDHAVTLKSLLTSRPLMYAGAAMGALVVASCLPVGRLAQWRGLVSLTPFLVPVILLGLIAVYVPAFGHSANESHNSHRWISLPIAGGLSFQPSELAKWGLIPVVAWWCIQQGDQIRRYWPGLVPALGIIGLVCAIVALEDLGTAVLIASACTLVLVAGGASVWKLASLMPLALPPAVFLFMGDNSYRLRRIVTFMDPYADPEGAGYHMIQSLVAIANGHGTGRGLGFGLQKFGYLPEDRTDFLFAVICEETGIAGALTVCLLYTAMIWAGLIIVRRQQHLLLKLIALGIIATVGLQAIINLAVVTGLAPTKGIALPLLSAGGTGWVFTAAALGLLVAIDRSAAPAHDDLAYPDEPEEERRRPPLARPAPHPS